MHEAEAKSRPLLSPALLFAPVFIAVYLTHWTLLRLPYYWDEGSYYIPAAWDFYRLGTLIPVTTMRNAHPPLPSILLAGWWKLTGFHVYSTRLLMCLVTTFALLAVFRVAELLLDDAAAALTTMLLTALYPVWFAQSTLAHADMFAAAFTLWGLVYSADRNAWSPASKAPPISCAIHAALLFALAALAKETAIVIPAGLFLLEVWMALRPDRFSEPRCLATQDRMRTMARCSFVRLAAMAFPAVPLALWYVYHRWATGFTFGNPEFLRYNASANLSPMRVLLSLWHRLTHMTIHMNLFVPVLLACAVVLASPPKAGFKRAPFLTHGATQFLLVVLGAQWLAFSVLGGALLTRYLLPAYPLLLILCVAAWRSTTSSWPAFAALTAIAFVIGCQVAPPYAFTPEDNLSYRDMIVVHQHAIRQLQQRFPGATVLTAWPVAADLQRPELGYVQQPIQTVSVDNFSAEQVARAAALERSYTVALVFSTKYDPPPGGLDMSGRSRRSDSLYYDYHRDLRPREIAQVLGGTVVWQEEHKGEWAALLRVPSQR